MHRSRVQLGWTDVSPALPDRSLFKLGLESRWCALKRTSPLSLPDVSHIGDVVETMGQTEGFDTFPRKRAHAIVFCVTVTLSHKCIDWADDEPRLIASLCVSLAAPKAVGNRLPQNFIVCTQRRSVQGISPFFGEFPTVILAKKEKGNL